MDKKTANIKSSLDAIKDEQFYKKLDESSKMLRLIAGETAEFLISVKTKTPQFSQLIKAFQTTKTIPIERMDQSLEEIKEIYGEINRDMSKKNKLPLDQKSFFALMDRQNRFNEEVNHLFANAVSLYESAQTQKA